MRWSDLKKRLKIAQPLHIPPKPESSGIFCLINISEAFISLFLWRLITTNHNFMNLATKSANFVAISGVSWKCCLKNVWQKNVWKKLSRIPSLHLRHHSALVLQEGHSCARLVQQFPVVRQMGGGHRQRRRWQQQQQLQQQRQLHDECSHWQKL